MKKEALIDIEGKLVVTTRNGVEGQHGIGEWEVQIAGCKIDPRMYCIKRHILGQINSSSK